MVMTTMTKQQQKKNKHIKSLKYACSHYSRADHSALMMLDMHLRSYLCAYLCTSQAARIYVRTCQARNISRILIEVLPHVLFTSLLLKGLLTQQIDLPSGNGPSLFSP